MSLHACTSLLISAALSLTLSATPPPKPAQQAVLDAENAWSAALVSGDVNALDRAMGPDLTYGHATGDMDTKASYLGRIRSGTLKYTQFQYDPGISVRVYGKTAVLNGSAEVKSINNGQASDPHLRFLHVYVHQNGHWILIAHQSTRLPK